MGKFATKAADNMFCKARYEAAKYNDKMYSREGAAEELGMDRTRLAKIELGSINPHPDEVLMMSEIYNAPEIKNYFCTTMCPLGRYIPKASVADLDRISIKALSIFRKIAPMKDSLLDIVEDGVISDEEKPQLNEILETLDAVSSIAQDLRLYIEKNLK